MSTMHGWRRGRRGATRHGGFTLLEMLLVTLLVAVMAAMSIPMFRGTMAGQELRKAGSLVIAGLNQARVAAIRSGTPHQFYYTADGAEYWVEPTAAAASGVAAGTTPSGSVPMGVTSQLPNSIRFIPGIGVSIGGGAGAAVGAAGVAGAASGTAAGGGVESVMFFPDGSSHDALLTLVHDRRGRAVTVSVRGLTGISRMGALESYTGAP